MIITRNAINEKIKFRDYDKGIDPVEYSYQDLSTKIDFFKNFLLDRGAKKGESVLIGYAPSLDQIALFFAVCELGLNFIVNDYKILDDGDLGFIDTKTKILLPINYFFDYSDTGEFKREYLANLSNHYVTQNDLNGYNNYEKNDVILAEPNDILMRCTSSGTTGTPKKVEHTQEFLYNISKRNTVFFDGTVGLCYNLNHGSSLATYFIPALMSMNVENFWNVPDHILRIDGQVKYDESVDKIIKSLDHVMIPYSDQLIELLNAYEALDLTYYTLSSISPLIYLKRSRCKDIVSIFGCNETSGPLMINRSTYEDFDPAVYRTIDGYYEFTSIDPLKVQLKEYDIEINTKDWFTEIGHNRFKFNGRKDLLRINGVPVSKKYEEYLKSRGNLVYDTLYNEIYLCIWDSNKAIKNGKYVDIIVNNMNNIMRLESDGKHRVSKVRVLNRQKFVAGVKLDQELIRSYFREKVEEYAKV